MSSLVKLTGLSLLAKKDVFLKLLKKGFLQDRIEFAVVI
jgi:hypothetical protein